MFETVEEFINFSQMNARTKPMDNELLLNLIRGIVTQKIIFCAIYGSRVYGTNTADSDYDITVIVSEGESMDLHDLIVEGVKMDITVVTLERFRLMVDNCDVYAIETIMSPEQFVLFSDGTIENIRNEFRVNEDTKRKIRSAFSAKSDWAEVRGRKKLIDRELKIAIRSLWHSYRIIKFGIQLAKKGIIDDFDEANTMWDELKIIDERDMTGELFKEQYKKWVKGGLLTEYKTLLPK